MTGSGEVVCGRIGASASCPFLPHGTETMFTKLRAFPSHERGRRFNPYSAHDASLVPK